MARSRRLHPVLARQPGPVTHPPCQKDTLMRIPRKPGTRKARFALTGVALAALVAIPSSAAAASTGSPSHPAGSDPASAAKPTIVLEHGAWADGSSWSGVVTRLQQDGYTVDVPPNPLRGVSSDSAYLASYLATVPGPVVLAGHSYTLIPWVCARPGNNRVPERARRLTKAAIWVCPLVPIVHLPTRLEVLTVEGAAISLPWARRAARRRVCESRAGPRARGRRRRVRHTPGQRG